MLNNIIEYIKSPKVTRTLTILYCGEKFNIDKLSYFDIFKLWEASLPMMQGYAEAEAYRAWLNKQGCPYPNGSTYTLQDACQRWRALLGQELPTDRAFNSTPVLGAEKKFLPASAVEIENILSKNTIKCDNINRLVSACSISTEAIYINILDADYKRPDIHSASMALSKQNSGENLNPQERNILSMELAILLLKEGRAKSLKLSGRLDVALEFLFYLKKQSLFSGKAYCHVNGETDMQSFGEACLGLYPSIALRPYAVDTAALAESYPIGAFAYTEKQGEAK